MSPVWYSAPSALTEVGLDALLGAVEHVHLEVALPAHEGGQQPDRPGPGDQHALVHRARARGDAVDLLPRLGEDARRLGEHAEVAELVRDRDSEVLLDGHELGAVAVEPLDAALGVLAVAAHVPLALGAAGARDGVGPADDARHELALLETSARPPSRGRAARGRARAARGRAAARRERPPAISRSVPQTPSRTRLDEQLAVLRLGLGQLRQLGAVGTPGNDRHRAHQRGKSSSPPKAGSP